MSRFIWCSVIVMSFIGQSAQAKPEQINLPKSVRSMMLNDIYRGWDREKEYLGIDPKAILLRVEFDKCEPIVESGGNYECKAREVYKTSTGTVTSQEWSAAYALRDRNWFSVVAVSSTVPNH